MTEKKKITRFTVEILSNGFTTESYGYNPYGADTQGKSVRGTASDVMQEFLGIIAHNDLIAAEEEAKKRKEEAKTKKDTLEDIL